MFGRYSEPPPPAMIFSAYWEKYRDPFIHNIVSMHGLDSSEVRFGLARFAAGDRRLVVLSELPDNHGTSLTNMVEDVARGVVNADPDLASTPLRKITFVDHLSDDYCEKNPMVTTLIKRVFYFDLVLFEKRTWVPTWVPLDGILQGMGGRFPSMPDAIARAAEEALKRHRSKQRVPVPSE